MKHLLITSALTAVLTLNMNAQTEATSDRRAEIEEWKTEVKASLDLTEQQAKSWEQIDERYKLQRKAYKEQHRAQMEAHKKRMIESREAQKAEIDALLTPEQRTKLDELREAEKARRKDERGQHRGEHPSKKGKTPGN
jgi:Spy/CpxP family protein refolding chaperone